jgi:GWxTD domain-containing protein
MVPVQLAFAQSNTPASGGSSETVARPLTERQQRQREAALRKELERPFRRWLDEDVSYIISPEERAVFGQLQTAEEMEQFIEQFWLRRDPTPDTAENEFKEEHYRRIAYANDRYSSGFPGWKTDRGWIYIVHGPPDEITDHSQGGTYVRPYEEGGGTTSVYPFQIWRYRYIEGVGTDVELEFVDPTLSGQFHLTMDPTEKDALLHVPGAGLTTMEQLGLANKNDRIGRTDGTALGIGATTPMMSSMNQFERLRIFTEVQKPPPVKFTDLEAVIDSTIKYNMLPMETRVDFMKMTNSTILTNVTVQFERKDLQFEDKSGMSTATVNILMRVTSMARRVVAVDENVVNVDAPTPLLADASKGISIYQKSIPLPPGTYRLNVVAKDVVGGNMNNYELALHVPYYDDEVFAMSSLVLADQIEKVPTRSIGTGQFVIGTSKVRPRLSETFRRDEKMGIYFQLYNFEADEQTHKPRGSVQYEVVKNGNNEKIFDYTEQIASIDGSSASQTIVEKLLPLEKFEPGDYTLRLKVTDSVRGESLTPEVNFKVN